jgi:putative transposase
VSAKFELIDAQKADFPLVKMCEWADVSTSGYYEWWGRPASATAIRREHLKTRRIQRVSASHEMILCDERRLECAVRY